MKMSAQTKELLVKALCSWGVDHIEASNLSFQDILSQSTVPLESVEQSSLFAEVTKLLGGTETEEFRDFKRQMQTHADKTFEVAKRFFLGKQLKKLFPEKV